MPHAPAPYETLTIPTTNYSTAGAKFISPTGSNANAGTEALPWLTAVYAISQCNPTTSTTLVFRGGTYRETIGGASNKFIIQNYPGEQVWFSGSDVVTGWTFVTPRWRVAWTYEPTSTVDAGLVDPAYPTSADALWVFIDGAPLLQVATLAECGAGEFFHDKAANFLYIGDDPTAHTVEVTARSRFIELFIAGNTFRGVGFKHYATHQAVGASDGAVRYNVNGGLTLDNCIFAWNSARGLTSYGDGLTITGETSFMYNGWNGFTVNSCHGAGLLITGKLRCNFNNFKHFAIGDFATAASAGCKITDTYPCIIRGTEAIRHEFNDNWGMGLWPDLSVKDAEIVYCEFERNEDHGLFYEVSAYAIIAGNYAIDNVRTGYQIGGANNIKLWHNTAHGNGQPIFVYEDDRTSAVDPDITYNTALVELKNNIFAESTAGNYLLGTADNNSPDTVSAENMISALDYNAYHRLTGPVPANTHRWSNLGGADSMYATLAAFVAAEVGEDNGVSATSAGGAAHPWFRDELGGDYRLSGSATALLGAGVALPADVAAALGLSAGARYNIGADFTTEAPDDLVPTGITSAQTFGNATIVSQFIVVPPPLASFVGIPLPTGDTAPRGAHPQTLAAGGCTYAAVVARRGGASIVAELDYEHIAFNRKVDTTSDCTITVSSECGGLDTIQPLEHELLVFRNGVLVWCGPIIQIGDRDGTSFSARDLTWWFERRVLPYDREFEAVDLATIFQTAASDALSLDPSPNITLATSLTGILGTRSWFGPPVEAKRAADILRELARDGVDYTAVGREMRVGGEEVPTEAIAGLSDDHFDTYDVDWRGLDVATRVYVTGKYSAFGDSGMPSLDSADNPYGLVEHVAQEDNVEDDESAGAGASSRRQMLSTLPAYVNGTLAGVAPVTFDELIPGARVGLALRDTRRPVVGAYRLADVKFTVDARSQETIATSFIPLGTLE